jgi:phospholipase/lecithinase/hemolysin
MRLPVRLIRLTILLAALFTFSSAASAQTYDAFYAFGDSLADNGNDHLFTKRIGAQPAIPPSDAPFRSYFNGRFSNGYVAFEYLWDMLGGQAPGTPGGLKPFLAAPILPLNAGLNFSFGGTGTPFLDQTPGGLYLPGLRGQVELFRIGLLGRKPPKKALYAIVSGANDYRVDQYNTPLGVPAVVGNIIASIETLYDIGARDVLVLDLPDLGLLPGAGPTASQQTALSAAHNQALEAALDALQQRHPRLTIFRGRFAEAFALLPPVALANIGVPALDAAFAQAGMPNPYPFPRSACLFVDPTLCQNVPTSAVFPQVFNAPLPFVFWDVVHPTALAHQVLAQYLYSVIGGGN